jgi:putative ABC transport system permease protein
MDHLRYAFRGLLRRPAFAALAVLTLALGIGANAAIFSVFDAVLLRPLPYPDSERIVMPWEFSEEIHHRLGFDRLPSSPADFIDYLTRNTTFERFASMRTEQVNLIGDGEPERIGAVRVSPEFFDVLGVQPIVGRSFGPGDHGGDRVVLIAYGLWQRRFGGDPAISGRTMVLNGEPATIAGVLPPWFQFPAAGELPEGFGFSMNPVIWTLDLLTPQQQRNRGGKSLALVGRLKPGITASAAQQDLATIAADIERISPRENAGWTVRVISLREQLVGPVRPGLLALVAAVGVVLLIACANVANLLLVRAAARQRELCVRYALGATRSRLVMQLLAESLVLALLAGLTGLVFAWWMLRMLLVMVPTTLLTVTQARLDWRVVAFTLVLSVATGLVFGTIPALYGTQHGGPEGLRGQLRGTIGGRKAHRTRNALVVGEVALAVLLLIGSVLLIQTFVRLTRVDTGFRSDRILTMEIALPKPGYQPARAAAFFETLVQRVSTLPGVETAGATSGLPLSGRENLVLVTIEGWPPPEPGQEIISDYRVVTPGYFGVLGIRSVAGDGLPADSGPESRRLCLINELMARTLWPSGDAIGRRLKLASFEQEAPWYTIAGVVGDTRHTGLDRALRPQVYVHHRQDPNEQMSVVLRTTGDPTALAAPVRAAVLAIDANQPVARVRTMEEVLRSSVASRRFHVFLVAVFTTFAVVLSVVGLYAVVSYSVAERIPEMGIRLALGALPSNLLRLVLTDGLKLVTAGLVIGVAAALVLTRFLETLLFGVDTHDAATFVLAPTILFVAGLLGCLAPALRAMRIDPSVALRFE